MLNRLRHHRGLHVLFAAVILLVVIFAEVPGAAKYSNVIQNSGHAPAFGLIALLLLDCFKPNSRHPLRPLLYALALTIALGIASELAQAVLHRDAEVLDVVHDAVGAVCALSAWFYYRQRGVTNARWPRRLALTIALISGGIALQPLMLCGAAYWHRAAQLPVIAQFRSPLDLYFIESTDPRAAITEAGLYTRLEQSSWPGISIIEPAPDWSRYRELYVEVSNPGLTALPLGIRVNDRQHTYDYRDRFNRGFTVAPHTRVTLHWSLDEIAAAPRGRRMDMRNIATIILFRSGAVVGQSLILHRIWLQ